MSFLLSLGSLALIGYGGWIMAQGDWQGVVLIIVGFVIWILMSPLAAEEMRDR